MSELEEILILKIKFLAGNNILNLSPTLLGVFFFIKINFYIRKYVFSKIYINKEKNFIYEVGIIYKFFLQFFIVEYIKSADCFLILPWKNRINKYKEKIYLLLFNIWNSSFSSINNFLLVKKYEHISKHKKPNSEDEFGFYLAGLIEGDGYIGKRSIEISFHISDSHLAYYIKKQIGYGNITKYSHTKNAIRFTVWNKEGILKVFNLINGKFFSEYKNDQIRKYLENNKCTFVILPSLYKLYPNDKVVWKNWILNNYWLSGFTDADGSFTIHMSKSKTHKLGYNMKLEYKVVQKHEDVILGIKEAFGGHHYYDNLVYRYRFASLKEQHKLIDYFDKFQLNSSKYIRYLKWRKCYLFYLNRQHLEAKGIKKILNIINSLRD